MRSAPEGTAWAVQTVCAPVCDGTPAIGGLVLWKDKENFLRLDRGTFGDHEITFAGCVDNSDVIIGRGSLEHTLNSDQGGTRNRPEESVERLFLRLERNRRRVKALCSADGERWFTVGQVEFPFDGPVHVGLHATGVCNFGYSNTIVCHGAHPDGTAIRFESFTMWEVDS
jgi:hypothetical protein